MIRMSAWILVAVLAIAGWPPAGAGEPLTPAAESPVRLAQEAPARPGIMRPDLKALAISVVPDLRGQTVAEARASLEKSGLKLGEVGRVTAQQEPGMVVRQSPQAKETTTRGSAVNVWIAEAAQVKVPKLTGLSLKQAETALARHGLRLGQVARMASGDPEGNVVRQNPAADSPADRGSSVNVWIAEAPPIQALTVKVPDLLKRQVKDAAAILEKSRLRLGDVTSLPSDAPEGTVLRQSPSAGQGVEPGSPVSVWIAEAPPVQALTVKVPDLLKRQVKEAAAILAKSRLRLGDVTSLPSDAPEGTVLRQSPSAGQGVEPGSTVSVWVAKASAPTVPDVVGRSLKEAGAILAKSGFSMREAGREESRMPEGAVARQSPASGESATKGSAVNVWLADAAMTTAPDLRGLSIAAAEQRLRESRLRLGAQSTQPSLPPGGEVVGQKPSAGEKLKVGGTVDVVSGDGSQARVPGLVGQTERAAAERLDQAGLRARRAAVEESPRPEREVLRQRPAEGSVVARGSVVDYWIAVPQKVAVPRIIGRRAAEAMAELRRLELAGEQAGAEESSLPEGEILRQDPAPDSRVLRGSRVGFWVASPMLVTVPDLSGMTGQHAAERVRAEGLVVGEAEPEESREPEGRIIRQDPPRGARVPRGTRVNVWVATPVRVPVPGLVGLSVGEARARLSDLSLAAQPPERNDAPEGTIIAQEPPQGTRVPLGTNVMVRVSAGPPPTWPWVAGGGIGAALLAAGAGLLWARRPPRSPPPPAPPAAPTVRVRMGAPDASVPDRLPMDAKAPEIRLRSRLVSGDSDVAAEKLVLREERRES